MLKRTRMLKRTKCTSAVASPPQVTKGKGAFCGGFLAARERAHRVPLLPSSSSHLRTSTATLGL
jgi:hypothetical protein